MEEKNQSPQPHTLSICLACLARFAILRPIALVRSITHNGPAPSPMPPIGMVKLPGEAT